MAKYGRLPRITNDEFEKLRLNFSICANRDWAALRCEKELLTAKRTSNYNHSGNFVNSLPLLHQMRQVCFYLKPKNGKITLDYYTVM